MYLNFLSEKFSCSRRKFFWTLISIICHQRLICQSTISSKSKGYNWCFPLVTKLLLHWSQIQFLCLINRWVICQSTFTVSVYYSFFYFLITVFSPLRIYIYKELLQPWSLELFLHFIQVFSMELYCTMLYCAILQLLFPRTIVS